MVWVKLTDDLPDAAARANLSDAAFRVHIEGLCWAMRRENGGLLDHLDIRRACETEDPKAAVRELVDAGWWEPAEGDRLQIVQSMDDQPEPDVIEARRCKTADRQRRHRRRKAGLSRRDDMRDETRDPGRDGTGRGNLLPQPVAKEGGEVQPQLGSEDWPEVARPTVDQVRDTLHRHDNQDYCKSCGMTAPGHTRSCKTQRRAA